MRLRRIATSDYHIVDENNGERHEAAFTTLIRDNGLLWEAEVLPRSYGGNSWFGKFAPAAGKELLSSLPAIVRALVRGKVKPLGALKPHRIPKQDLDSVQQIFDRVESREQRYELNLYIIGEDEGAETPETPTAGAGNGAGSAPAGEGTEHPQGGDPSPPPAEGAAQSDPTDEPETAAEHGATEGSES
jgi:succinate dehydrogenase / fumarate reductase, iron-sulfur subunit